MRLFDKFLRKEEPVPLNADDSAITAIADGELIDVHTVSDPVFAQEMMGKSVAFRFRDDKVTLCSPANGTLAVVFPTHHAFGIVMNNGTELLIHCGIDTVNARGNGFHLLGKKQGDTVKAGEPIIEADIRKLSKTYDMSTMLIITKSAEQEIHFIKPQAVKRGQPICE